MGRSKRAKLSRKREKLKKKMKGKKMKLGAKITAGMAALFLITTTGCQTADPASRSNATEYGDIVSDVCVKDRSTLTINVTMGDGLFASADGGGDKTDSSPTQTTETTPRTSIAWGASSAGMEGETKNNAISGLEKILKALKEGASAPPVLTPQEQQACQDCCSDCTP